jgi:hypothetical protein
MFGDYHVEIARSQLLEFKQTINSKSAADMRQKSEIAVKMVDDLFKSLPEDFSKWNSFSYAEKREKIRISDSSSRAILRRIALMDALFPIINDPQSRDFFTKVFLATLPDVYSIALGRSSVLPHKLSTMAMTLPMVAAPFIIPGPAPTEVVLGSIFGPLFAWNANIYATIHSNYGSNILAGTKRFGRKIFAPGKARTQLKAKSADFVEKEIVKAEEAENQSSFIFSRIKEELVTGVSDKDVFVPMWGQGISEGVAILYNRYEGFTDRLTEINKVMNNVFEKNQSSAKDSKLMDKKIDETLVNVGRGQVYGLLQDLQPLKMDLLTLAHALDQYSSGIKATLEKSGLSNNYRRFAETKISDLHNQSIIINSLAGRIKAFELGAAENLSYLNSLHISIQAKKLSGK